jgi:hypothetical protein
MPRCMISVSPDDKETVRYFPRRDTDLTDRPRSLSTNRSGNGMRRFGRLTMTRRKRAPSIAGSSICRTLSTSGSSGTGHCRMPSVGGGGRMPPPGGFMARPLAFAVIVAVIAMVRVTGRIAARLRSRASCARRAGRAGRPRTRSTGCWRCRRRRRGPRRRSARSCRRCRG